MPTGRVLGFWRLAALLPRRVAVGFLRRRVSRLSLPERFTAIDAARVYADPRGSRSGPGSSLAETAAVRRVLPGLLRRHGVRSVLDIPCGDFHWMREVRLEGIEYTGADVIAGLVAANRRRFAAPGRTFLVLDLTRDALPRTDLVLCRDLLVHLSFADARAALAAVRESGSRLLLTTTFDRETSEDIVSGDFRPVDLRRAPFDLPPALEEIDEECRLAGGAFADKRLALWRVADLPGLGGPREGGCRSGSLLGAEASGAGGPRSPGS
jgi:hypothetical protein